MTINSGFSHEKWWFSIAMLNYQRVIGFSIFVPPVLGIHLWKPPKKTPKKIAGHAAPIQDLGRPDSFEGAHNLNSWVFPPRSSTTQRHPGTMVTMVTPWPRLGCLGMFLGSRWRYGGSKSSSNMMKLAPFGVVHVLSCVCNCLYICSSWP
jgi:hypothetical protein